MSLRMLIISELKDTEEKYNKLTVENEDSVASYYKIRQQLDNLGKELLSFVQKPQYILPFLQPGRLVQVYSSFIHSIYCPSYSRGD